MLPIFLTPKKVIKSTISWLNTRPVVYSDPVLWPISKKWWKVDEFEKNIENRPSIEKQTSNPMNWTIFFSENVAHTRILLNPMSKNVTFSQANP